MTKEQFIKICAEFGYSCSYSGKDQIMYISTEHTHEDIQLVALQRFGLIPDFQIIEQ